MDLFNSVNGPVSKKKCISSGSLNKFGSPSDSQDLETIQNLLPLNHLSKSQKESSTNLEPIKLDIDFLVRQAEGIYELNRSKMFSQFDYSPPELSTEINKKKNTKNNQPNESDNLMGNENFFRNKKQNENENELEKQKEMGNGKENRNGIQTKRKKKSFESDLLILEKDEILENRQGIDFETNSNSNSNYLSCNKRQLLPFSPPVRTKNPIMYDENFDPVIELGILGNLNQKKSNFQYF
ncbi:hypothetical protein M0812_25494 [Anaeramoeba flamelloides]|uniref:Uncharacterized protein n=1 Tax=Anaeramoeba flamelloides TaxID=1746091 RepID=A0AAV7YGV3_9EUKA|nr:hypothetical protein M0812_25494 [Anaeramoeba flamelloides]